MAGRGPAPKATSSRPRDQRRRKEAVATVVTPDDELRGPDLPTGFAIRTCGCDEACTCPTWPEATQMWWDTWRRSAQAKMFTSTDWAFLLDTALLHAALWNGNGQVASELRLRVAKFGATPEDRARLRIQFEPTGDDEDEKPKPAAAKKATSTRRARLLKVVDDGAAG